MKHRYSAILLSSLLPFSGALHAAEISADQCKQIGEALTSLATVNLKSQETALLFQKESMTVMGELVLIDQRAFQEFSKFQKKVSDGFSAVGMDAKTVARGIMAFREVCPTK